MAAQIGRANLDRLSIRLVYRYYGVHISVTPYATYHSFNKIYVFSLRYEPAVVSNKGARDTMTGSTISIEGVLMEFLAPIITKIV